MQAFFLSVIFPCMLMLILNACSPKQLLPSHPKKSWDTRKLELQRKRLVSDAHQLRHRKRYHVQDTQFSFDCSGYIHTVLYKNGFDISSFISAHHEKGNGVWLIQKYIEKQGRILPSSVIPKMGDIVFFSNTYDRNKDRRLNDKFTHIGMVEQIDSDGRVTFLHNMQKKVQRGFFHLNQPDQYKNSDGKILNSFMRRKKRSDPRKTKYLAGDLVENIGSLVLEPSSKEFWVQLDEGSTIP